MLSWHSYLVFCMIYAAAIAVPGPDIVATVARALGGGFRASIPAAFGIAAGHWFLMSLSVFGLTLVAQVMGTFFLAVKYAGAAYLLWLAYKYWTAPVHAEPEIDAASLRNGFFGQLALGLGNPKAIVFFLALLPSIIDMRHVSFTGYAALSAATWILFPAIGLIYAALAARVRTYLTSLRARRNINRTAAVAMAGAGATVAVA